jgi:UDP-N-acetyl-D-mannosaminouronate:lipid I N-acetyl-D-mannosaminouronosyltransferase
MTNTVEINGINTFAPKSRMELLDYVAENKMILIALNAEKILNSTEEMKILMNKNIVYPDGIGAVWALKRKGYDAIKIPGCELWLDIIERFYKEKSFYLVGAKDSVLRDVIAKLKLEFKEINILAFRDGYIETDVERKVLINDIVSKKPDVVFVAMGSPKQELLMQDMSEVHSAIYQGLGGSFDVYVGNVKRAPRLWVKLNLEWFYRLMLQPTRFSRQYKLWLFFIKLFRNKL